MIVVKNDITLLGRASTHFLREISKYQNDLLSAVKPSASCNGKGENVGTDFGNVKKSSLDINGCKKGSACGSSS